MLTSWAAMASMQRSSLTDERSMERPSPHLSIITATKFVINTIVNIIIMTIINILTIIT